MIVTMDEGREFSEGKVYKRGNDTHVCELASEEVGERSDHECKREGKRS
jgi:hypothetical protein